MKVLLSIKPEFANKIFDGQKRFEYRKVIFKQQKIQTVVVYASSPVCKVIGEFDIDTIPNKRSRVIMATNQIRVRHYLQLL